MNIIKRQGISQIIDIWSVVSAFLAFPFIVYFRTLDRLDVPLENFDTEDFAAFSLLMWASLAVSFYSASMTFRSIFVLKSSFAAGSLRRRAEKFLARYKVQDPKQISRYSRRVDFLLAEALEEFGSPLQIIFPSAVAGIVGMWFFIAGYNFIGLLGFMFQVFFFVSFANWAFSLKQRNLRVTSKLSELPPWDNMNLSKSVRIEILREANASLVKRSRVSVIAGELLTDAKIKFDPKSTVGKLAISGIILAFAFSLENARAQAILSDDAIKIYYGDNSFICGKLLKTVSGGRFMLGADFHTVNFVSETQIKYIAYRSDCDKGEDKK